MLEREVEGREKNCRQLVQAATFLLVGHPSIAWEFLPQSLVTRGHMSLMKITVCYAFAPGLFPIPTYLPHSHSRFYFHAHLLPLPPLDSFCVCLCTDTSFSRIYLFALLVYRCQCEISLPSFHQLSSHIACTPFSWQSILQSAIHIAPSTTKTRQSLCMASGPLSLSDCLRYLPPSRTHRRRSFSSMLKARTPLEQAERIGLVRTILIAL